MCIFTVQYRSYTINSHRNPHNLASRMLWWVSELSVLTPPSICLFKGSKQAKKERLAEPLHSTVEMTGKAKICYSNSTQACYKSHKSPSPRSGLSHASGGGKLAWLRPERLWRRLIDHRSLAWRIYYRNHKAALKENLPTFCIFSSFVVRFNKS